MINISAIDILVGSFQFQISESVSKDTEFNFSQDFPFEVWGMSTGHGVPIL